MNRLLLEPKFTLRDTLTLKYYISSNYKSILQYSDLPYFFDYQNKPWRLRVCNLSGFYYSRIHRSYTLWLNNGLKRKIGLYMPLIMKAPIKRNKPIDPWYRRASSYLDSYYKINTNWLNPKYHDLSLNSPNIYKLTSSSIFDNFEKSREHRHVLPCGFFGLDHDLFISSYNNNWHNIYNHDSNFYRSQGRGPYSFLIGVNSFLMHVGLNINLFDTTLMILPEPFWTYLKKKDDFRKLNYNNYFFFPYNNFYKKIITSIYELFQNIILVKLSKLKNLLNFTNNNIILNFYKIILYKVYLVFIKKFYKKQKFFSVINKKLIFNLSFFKFFFYKKTNLKNLLNNTFIKVYNKLDKYNSFLYEYKNKNIYNEKFKQKNFFLNLKKIRSLKTFDFFLKESKNNNSNFFINTYNYMFTKKFNIFKYNKKINFDYFKFFNNFNYYDNFKKFKFSTFIFSKKTFNNLEKVDILNITTYGKFFLNIPEKLYQNSNYDKASSLFYNIYKMKSFLFTNSSIYLDNLLKFNSNFFYLISLLIKLNFGFSFSLFSFYTKNYSTELNNILFINIEYFIYKYFIFLNKYLNVLKETKNDKFISPQLLFLNYVILNDNNYILKNIKKKLFNKKFKYLDFCLSSHKFLAVNDL